MLICFGFIQFTKTAAIHFFIFFIVLVWTCACLTIALMFSISRWCCSSNISVSKLMFNGCCSWEPTNAHTQQHSWVTEDGLQLQAFCVIDEYWVWADMYVTWVWTLAGQFIRQTQSGTCWGCEAWSLIVLQLSFQLIYTILQLLQYTYRYTVDMNLSETV